MGTSMAMNLLPAEYFCGLHET